MFLNLLKRPAIRNVLLVSLVLFASKGFGFIRTIQLYSTKEYADVYSNPQRIQTLLVSILIAGTIISTLTPTGTKIKNAYGQKFLNQYFTLHFAFISLFFLTISTICSLFAETILKFLTNPKIVNEIIELGAYNQYVQSGQIIVFGVVFFAIHSVLQSYLSIYNRFFFPTLTGIITSVLTVFAIWYFSPNFAVPANALLVLSLVVGCGLCFINCLMIGYKFSDLNNINQHLPLLTREIIKDYKNMIPKTMLIPIPMLSAILLNTKYQDLGTMTSFDTADNIQSIFGAFVTALGMILLPKLSNTLYTKSDFAVRTQIFSFIKKLLPLTILGTIITIFGGEYILRIIKFFGKRSFNLSTSDLLTVQLTQILAVSLIFSTLNEVLIKYYLIKNHILFLISGNIIACLLVASIVFQPFFTLKPEFLASYALVGGLVFLNFWYFLGFKFYKTIDNSSIRIELNALPETTKKQ
jgi:peptidoglycan biosynthesis protein MviN/MurJ (putative lipid II flippase)